ncbi:MAG: hypothetical protein R2827_15665 [Bdellovibrionales bacterium]
MAIPVAILTFKYVEIRFFAGAIAGAYFLTSSAIVAGICIFNRRPLVKSPIFWSSLGFFTFFALPIFLGRLIYPPDVPFNEVLIFGVRGDVLHRISTIYYSIMILLTLIESGTFIMFQQKKKPS